MAQPASRDKPKIRWPEGKRAAFTIFDDTDLTTMANGPVIYDLFNELGLTFTKSVWPLGPTGAQRVGGTTCADPEYLAWVRSLQAAGHEIGYHNTTDHPSTRERIIEGLDTFEEYFGHAPRVGADHSGNREALYWGPARLSGGRSFLYGAAQRALRPNRPSFSGDDPLSEHFWGDICRERIDYWRNFCFDEIDVLRVCPKLPYHDERRPFVKHWFASTDGSNRARLLHQLADEKLDRLEAGGGACIMYAHLGVGLVADGRLDPAFEAAVRCLADRSSLWIAPVSAVLDHLKEQLGDQVLTDGDRRRLENRWVTDRLRHSGFVRRRYVEAPPEGGG